MNWCFNEYEITGDNSDIIKINDMYKNYKTSNSYKVERLNLHFFIQTILKDKNLLEHFKWRYGWRIDGKQKSLNKVFIGMKKK